MKTTGFMNKTFRLLKRLLKTLIGKDVFVLPEVKVNYEFVGSTYGGWAIDTSFLKSESIIYSFGVGEDTTFDISLILRFDARVYAFDPTPKTIEWVKSQNRLKNFIFTPLGISTFDGDEKFNLPVNSDYVSLSTMSRNDSEKTMTLPVNKLSTLMTKFGHEKIDVLKMDIEGSEYSVIEQLFEGNIRPKQILVEFHHRFKNIGIKKTKSALILFKKMGYKLFFVSNNGEEYSFVLQV
jgi:FkbM family methyltransferase